MKRVELQLLLGVVFGLGALFCLRMPVTFLSVLAEENCCIPPHTSSAAARFPQGAVVTVYIDSSASGFTGDEQLLIKSGFEDWNDETNNSRVTYNVETTPTPPPAGTNNTILVQFSNQTSTGTGGALLNMHSSSGPGRTSIYGEMILFSNIRDPNRVESRPEQIRATARHEVGHGIGLAMDRVSSS